MTIAKLDANQQYLRGEGRPVPQHRSSCEVDPSFVVTHPMSLEDAPRGYKIFRDKEDRCIKVVLKPGMKAAA